MSAKLALIALFATISLGLFSQRPTLVLTFTAENNGAYVQLNSIKVMNRTQGGDTVLYWPDTVLVLNYVGIPELTFEDNIFKVFPNNPNPVTNYTAFSIYVPEEDKVSFMLTDITGGMILHSERVMDKGKHSFRFTPGNRNLYFFTATWNGQSSSIKIVKAGSHSGGNASLEYTGSEEYLPQLKSVDDTRSFSFSPGDELLYIGFKDTLQSGMLDYPKESITYTFQFATNIPCPGTPTVDYEGQVYNTIQVFSQCWLKENLNVGTITDWQKDNGIIEKYCYNDEPDSCTKYGGLYRWHEMLKYYPMQGAQGICPPGWHIPSDEEWKVLEGAVDSQFGIGDNSWNYLGFNGYDAGSNLKASSNWLGNGNGFDLFGFAGLPGGYCTLYGDFYCVGEYGFWWSSSNYDFEHAILHEFKNSRQDIQRDRNFKAHAFSVRCLRDD